MSYPKFNDTEIETPHIIINILDIVHRVPIQNLIHSNDKVPADPIIDKSSNQQDNSQSDSSQHNQ